VAIVKLERVNGAGSFVSGPLSANVGDTVDYQLTVTAGPTTLTGVTLSDPNCDSGTLSPSGPQSLQANESRVFTCSHKLTAIDGAVGSYTNRASASGNGPQPPSTPVSATSQTVVVTIPPSVAIAKTERINGAGSFVSGPLSANVGDTVDYQITVTAGQTPLTSVTLSDPKCDSGTLSPSGPQSLQANESRVFTCSHKLATADGSSYTNTASVTGNGPNNTSVSAGPVSVVVNVSSGGGGGGGGGGTPPPSTPSSPPAAAPPAPTPAASNVTVQAPKPTPKPKAQPKPKTTPKPKAKPKPKPKAVFKPPVVKPKPKPAPCYVLSGTPGNLTVGSHAELRLRVTGNNKPISGARVEVKGAGILKLSGRTDAAGRVTMKLNPKKPGLVVLKAASHPSCATGRVGVVGAFSPPVTG
jgi:hypothetical protein